MVESYDQNKMMSGIPKSKSNLPKNNIRGASQEMNNVNQFMGNPNAFNQGQGVQTQKINFADIMSPVTKNNV